jgi:hypothetical protein
VRAVDCIARSGLLSHVTQSAIRLLGDCTARENEPYSSVYPQILKSCERVVKSITRHVNSLRVRFSCGSRPHLEKHLDGRRWEGGTSSWRPHGRSSGSVRLLIGSEIV